MVTSKRCAPPYVKDMREAVEIFVARKFGPGGAYDAGTPGAWRDSAAVKGSVNPYSEEFVDCLSVVAQYVYDTYGKFPNTFTTLVLTGYVQAVHLDTAFYDRHYRPGSYLTTHSEHMGRWHG